MGEWDRARLAYRELLGEDDPVAGVLGAGDVVDLRPGGPVAPGGRSGVVVTSGPGDLGELREIVESITGAATWPVAEPSAGELVRGSIGLRNPGPALRLLAAMEGLVVDRGAMWRTWKTTLELVAGRLSGLDAVTVEAVVARPEPVAERVAPL